jgi:hypothetical protein
MGKGKFIRDMGVILRQDKYENTPGIIANVVPNGRKGGTP